MSTIPNFEEVSPYKVVVPAGAYDAVLSRMSFSTSRQGKPLLHAVFTILYGDYRESKVHHYFALESEFGLRQLKLFSETANFRWEPSDVSQFAPQFLLRPLITRIVCRNSFSVLREDDTWESVSEDEYRSTTLKKSQRTQIFNWTTPLSAYRADELERYLPQSALGDDGDSDKGVPF